MLKKSIDIKTRKKIRKHLKDRHDKITEEDIKNAATDFSSILKKAEQEEEEEIIENITSQNIQR